MNQGFIPRKIRLLLQINAQSEVFFRLYDLANLLVNHEVIPANVWFRWLHIDGCQFLK